MISPTGSNIQPHTSVLPVASELDIIIRLYVDIVLREHFFKNLNKLISQNKYAQNLQYLVNKYADLVRLFNRSNDDQPYSYNNDYN